LINDTQYNGYYLQTNPLIINTVTGEWTADIYVEVIDHFGLDDGNLGKNQNRRIFNAGEGFTAWWILQHVRGYAPFRTKMRFLFKIRGNYND